MSRHKVVTRRESVYPFRVYWACICGTRFSARYMGLGSGGVEAEFKKHEEDVNDLEEGTD